MRAEWNVYCVARVTFNFPPKIKAHWTLWRKVRTLQNARLVSSLLSTNLVLHEFGTFLKSVFTCLSLFDLPWLLPPQEFPPDCTWMTSYPTRLWPQPPASVAITPHYCSFSSRSLSLLVQLTIALSMFVFCLLCSRSSALFLVRRYISLLWAVKFFAFYRNSACSVTD